MRPLVIRANVGDTVQINFENRLDRRVSIHVQGLSYNVLTSDGTDVGYNPDSTTGSRICYTWQADQEGVFLFSDMADTLSGEDGTNVHGLFGAIIVEAAGSAWYDPVTGEPMDSGLFADIYHPARPAFREYAVFFHDELEILTKDNQPPVDPHTGLPNGTTAISYRAEPMRNRPPLAGHHAGPADTAEDISMSSWVYGDPAPPILRAYVGDPSRIRLIHGGVKETHVFHLHNHQWRLEPEDLKSTIIDSISISPQECYTLDILYGAGSLNGMIGDAIFHCHLYPHFHEGMWTLWRVFDRLQDGGGGTYPDGTPIEALMPLKDRPLPPPRDGLHPGYPNFVAGTFGEEPLQPPLGVLSPDGQPTRQPSILEEANFVENAVPGALYTDTCPCGGLENVKRFDIAAVQANVIYNDYGWHDPQGRFFVLREDIEKAGTLDDYLAKVACGDIRPEPLVIRANAGDCIEVWLTNFLPERIEASAFQLETISDIVGYHIHLVKFDTIVSDGAANGWNNIAGACARRPLCCESGGSGMKHKEYTTILVDVQDRIATVTFNRPEFANAYTPVTNIELREVLDALDEDTDVGCIVITGKGKHFSAGGDIYRMKRQIEDQTYMPKTNIINDGMLGYAIRRCGKPIIAMINGAAAGAGASLAVACDFRVMTQRSKIVMSFVNMGLSGDTGSIYNLYKLVGASKMTQMIMLGERMSGKEAADLGIAYLAEDDQLEAVTYALAKRLAAMPTYAIKRIKLNLLNTIYADLPKLAFMEADAMWDCGRTHDFEEAVNAFIEKRDPEFTGT